jgi:threonyl-tRNA synthetase
LRNEKVGFKIRQHSLARVPYVFVVGDQEMQNGAVNVRARGGENLGSFTFDEIINLLTNDIANLGRVVQS